ncbi:MAG: lysophospholipid acyltransferase family protein [Burkholderiaceae bacterium]
MNSEPVSNVFRPASLTVFNTPVVTPILRFGSKLCLRMLGWRLHGSIPDHMKKAVVIAAPHTSNWDLPYSLMAGFGLGLQAHWLGKASLFGFPFKGIMRWLGGIGVDRSRSGQLVSAAVDCFKQTEGRLFLMIPPEGTRRKVREWKTGFYYIAQGAQVPIIMAYMDHAKKEAGFGPCLEVTGDIEVDMATVKAFYAPIRGLKPDQFDAG